MQTLIVAAIVITCSAYAVWSLMPGAWRAALNRRLGRASAPASACSGCGGGCATAPAAPGAGTTAVTTAVITLHRRPKVKSND